MVGVAIIGCGMIAESHALAIKSDKRARLVAAAYGTNKEKGVAFAEKFNVPLIVGDYHELLSNPDISLVCLCTPSGIHAQCAADFACAGKSILCEKPLDITREAMTKMIDAAKSNHVRLGCVFPERTRAGLIRARDILSENRLGRMLVVECQYRGYRSHSYFKSSSWKGTLALDGGGCLMNQGIHAIDAMIFLTGRVSAVCGSVATLGRDIQVEDAGNALLEFENGARGAIMGTTLSHIPEGGPEGDLIRIECEKGSILYKDGKTTCFINKLSDGFEVEAQSLDDEEKELLSGASRPENIDMGAHCTLVSDAITSVLTGDEMLVPPESARHSVDVVLAIYESSKRREWVKI